MLKMGKSIPAEAFGQLLERIAGRRVTLYCLSDGKFTTYIVNDYNKRKIVENIIVLKKQCLIILGTFHEEDVIKRFNEIINSNELKDTYVPRPEMSHVLNEKTGRMVRVGSRMYKKLYPESKKKVGRPNKYKSFDITKHTVDLWNNRLNGEWPKDNLRG